MKVDHITINVVSMEKSIAFYKDVLGLEELNEVDMGDHVLHYFRLDGDTKLELIRYKDEQPEYHYAVKTKGLYRHFALLTEDVDGLYRKLKDHGTECLCEPGDVEKLHFRNILIRDPNGVEIEFIQK